MVEGSEKSEITVAVTRSIEVHHVRSSTFLATSVNFIPPLGVGSLRFPNRTNNRFHKLPHDVYDLFISYHRHYLSIPHHSMISRSIKRKCRTQASLSFGGFWKLLNTPFGISAFVCLWLSVWIKMKVQFIMVEYENHSALIIKGNVNKEVKKQIWQTSTCTGLHSGIKVNYWASSWNLLAHSIASLMQWKHLLLLKWLFDLIDFITQIPAGMLCWAQFRNGSGCL